MTVPAILEMILSWVAGWQMLMFSTVASAMNKQFKQHAVSTIFFRKFNNCEHAEIDNQN
jgi:hypothetical protein